MARREALERQILIHYFVLDETDSDSLSLS